MICLFPQVQILNKKVDVSKVTSKCGSKDNIKHKPGSTSLCLIFSSISLSSDSFSILLHSIPFHLRWW